MMFFEGMAVEQEPSLRAAAFVGESNQEMRRVRVSRTRPWHLRPRPRAQMYMRTAPVARTTLAP